MRLNSIALVYLFFSTPFLAKANTNIIPLNPPKLACKNLLKIDLNQNAEVILFQKKKAPPYVAPVKFFNESKLNEFYIFVDENGFSGSRPLFTKRDTGHWRMIREVVFPLDATEIFILHALAGPRVIDYSTSTPLNVKAYTSLKIGEQTQIFYQIVKFLIKINSSHPAHLDSEVLFSISKKQTSISGLCYWTRL